MSGGDIRFEFQGGFVFFPGLIPLPLLFTFQALEKELFRGVHRHRGPRPAFRIKFDQELAFRGEGLAIFTEDDLLAPDGHPHFGEGLLQFREPLLQLGQAFSDFS